MIAPLPASLADAVPKPALLMNNTGEASGPALHQLQRRRRVRQHCAQHCCSTYNPCEADVFLACCFSDGCNYVLECNSQSHFSPLLSPPSLDLARSPARQLEIFKEFAGRAVVHGGEDHGVPGALAGRARALVAGHVGIAVTPAGTDRDAQDCYGPEQPRAAAGHTEGRRAERRT